MIFQQPHLPKDKPATREQEWGFTLWEFIEGNWIYIAGILLVLFVFLWARYSWKRRYQK